MQLTRQKSALLIAGALVLAFLIGFVPMWMRARALDHDLVQARHELALARMQGHLGAAVSEGIRSNYEGSRQLMTGFFSELQARRGTLADRERQAAADEILAQRDEIITLLSRAEPEAVQRLNLLYARWFAVLDPAAAATQEQE